MSLRAQFDHQSHLLSFDDYPTKIVKYREKPPKKDSSYAHALVEDVQTKNTALIYFKWRHLIEIGISSSLWKNTPYAPREIKRLRAIGLAYEESPERTLEPDLAKLLQNAYKIEGYLREAIPILSEQLSPEYLSFFKEEASRAICVISCALARGERHLSKVDGVPGMYFHKEKSKTHIFINLKGTQPLGKGGFGKVRKVLWLNPPGENPKIVAKKVFTARHLDENIRNSYLEINACRRFSSKRGIIHLIAGGFYDDKCAVFLPIYEWDLHSYLTRGPSPLSPGEQLSLTSLWLDGLAAISTKGIHRDIRSENLFFTKSKAGIEAVIADLGKFNHHDQEKTDSLTKWLSPPEYLTRGIETPKEDVWAMGLALYELFSGKEPPFLYKTTKRGKIRWISGLQSHWIRPHLFGTSAPRFVRDLIDKMLEPNPDLRPTALEAFALFNEGMEKVITL